VKVSISDFLDIVKVIRMLYGLDPAKTFFEKNMLNFTGYEPKDLHRLGKVDTITVTSETNE